ncbi:MAG TPA: urease accessory protein UreF [Steroidobacteraceae bacterium]|nr:urease accessory protein UreF [Steroidobacteraceae bacterium]
MQTLLRLCHLVSPALPIGAFGYSQALEQAVELGWVRDEAGALAWLDGQTRQAMGTLDLPLLLRMHRAWRTGDIAQVRHWTQQLMASRETAELRAEERHLGGALRRVLDALGMIEVRQWFDPSDRAPPESEPALATLFSLAAWRWEIEPEDALCGYLWAWSENQVLAAIKLVPLGQSAGQRLLHQLIAGMPEVVERAMMLPDEAIGVGVFAPLLASALHETQYTRLFRS